MTHRSRAAPHIQPTMLGAVLLIGVLALSARPAVSQVTTKLVTAERMDPGPAFPMQGFLTVSHDSERPVELVLHAHRIEGDRIVDVHRSSPFKVAADRPYRLEERHLPGQRFYRGTVTGEVATTRDAIPLVSPERYGTGDGFWSRIESDGTGDGFWSRIESYGTGDGFWSRIELEKSFQEAQPRDAVVFIALPADDRSRRDAKAYPILVVVEGTSR